MYCTLLGREEKVNDNSLPCERFSSQGYNIPTWPPDRRLMSPRLVSRVVMLLVLPMSFLEFVEMVWGRQGRKKRLGGTARPSKTHKARHTRPKSYADANAQADSQCAGLTTSLPASSTRSHPSSVSAGFSGICWGLGESSTGARMIVDQKW